MVNVELIDKICAQIAMEPELFNMDSWFEMTPCKTTACIAGHAAMIEMNCKYNELPESLQDDPSDFALKALGLPYGSSMYKLFYATSWPQRFKEIARAEGTHKAAIMLLQETALLGEVPHD